MLIIALTGGIASGKSTIAARMAEHGAVVIDADALARDVVEPGTPGLEAIRERFGSGVIRPDGSLDRPALGSIVFTDEQARMDLNGITHPLVWKRALDLFARVEREDPDAVIVYDVPLLVEADTSRPLRFDYVVVAEVDHDERIRRLVELRGMTQPEARARVDAQATDAERRAAADEVLETSGTVSDTLARVDALWSRLVQNTPRHSPA